MIEIGQKIGNWEIIREAEPYLAKNGKAKQKRWLCKCACGNEKVVFHSSLTSGRSTSCGCMSKENIHKKADITGKVFGKLTVLYRVDDYISPKGARVPKWHCKCDCGNEIDVLSTSLRNGDTKTCGCTTNRKRIIPVKRKPEDLIGKNYGFLVVNDCVSYN